MDESPLSAAELARLRQLLDPGASLPQALGRPPALDEVVGWCRRLLATLEARDRERDEARGAEQSMRHALLERDLPPPGLLPGPGPRPR